MRSRAVFTIVQNEPVFLNPWLAYYSRHFEPSDIYVLDHDSTDGSVRPARDEHGVNVVQVHRDESFNHLWLCSVVRMFQRFLLYSYRSVLFAEVDEFVLPRPSRYRGLADYIEQNPEPISRCTGFNVVHRPEFEPALDFDRPLLAQRSTMYRSRMYSKCLLSRVPLEWGVGFHRLLEGQPEAQPEPDPDLLLVHIHRIDYDYCLRRHEASARRRWSERDIQMNLGVHNRIFEPEPFRAWFFDPKDLGEEELEIPEELKVF